MGRPIAKLVAEKLGYEYYDRDIIDKAIENIEFPVEKYLQMSDKPLSTYDRMMYPLGFGDAVKQDKIFKAEKAAIIDLATANNCVIVGRCSDYILKTADEKVNVFSVFVYAPIDARQNFCRQELEIMPTNINDYIYKIDKGRADYYKRHTGEEFSSRRYRNLMLDSSCVTKEQAAEIICQMAKYTFN